MKSGDRLKVEVLGPLRSWRDSDEIALGPPLQRAVFAVLAMRAGRPVSKSELIAGVWGMTPPASAEGNLHTYVSRLRRALDPGRAHRGTASLLVSDDTGYSLHIGQSDVDVLVFGQACADAARSVTGQDFTAAVSFLDTALGLWRGEALSGVPGPFAEAERERLAQARLTAVERRVAAVLALGGHRELCAELAGLVREHPVRESVRELQMLALYRSGRHTEALEVFRDTRRVLVRELGIEPGERLCRLHEQVLAFDPDLDLPAAPARRTGGFVSAPPVQADRAVEQDAAGSFVGRTAEVDRIRGLVAEVADGRGGVLWLEGEPGIGKTDLLAVSLSVAGDHGCRVAWATYHELGARFPLDVLGNCLGVGAAPDDPPHGDAVLAASDRLLSHVDERCAAAPLVLVVDNLQWADDVSVRVLRRLAVVTRQLPLLLVVASRPVSENPALLRLRDRVDVGGGVSLRLGALSDEDTGTLVRGRVGARPGPRLAELVARAAGNPFYIREILDILLAGEGITRTGDVADTAEQVTLVPLLDAVDGRLAYLSGETRTVLNWAALLGVEFTPADVATAMGRPAGELVRAFEEAVEADILVDAGVHLEFRHSLVHEVFRGRFHGPARDSLHAQAAAALAEAGAPVERIAQQLAAARSVTPQWMVGWLAAHHVALANRAPSVAVDLLARAVEHGPRDAPERHVLIVALVRARYLSEHAPVDLAREALGVLTDPAQAAEVREMLATMLSERGEQAAAVDVVAPWADAPGVPARWRTRHRQQLANLRRGSLDDLDAMARGAERELVCGDAYRTAHARQTLWLVCSTRRDHQRALAHIDRAVDAVRGRPDLTAKHLELLENRMCTLRDLDALAEAGRTLAVAADVADGRALPAGLRVAAAEHHYWTGRWEDVLVEVDLLTGGGPAAGELDRVHRPRLHGIAALVATRRDDEGLATVHLAVAEEHAPDGADFLLVARSTMAERGGDAEAALRLLLPLLDDSQGRTCWLPRFVRLAVAAGLTDLAHQAVGVCANEAAGEVSPARAYAAAEWAKGLVLADPAPVLRAAAHFRAVARRMELACVLEDAAALLAETGAAEQAAAALHESLGIYTELAACWDIRRAEDRLARLGVSRFTRPAEPRPDGGWEPLSPAEVQTATLAATGYGAPATAAPSVPPVRDIRSHVASVLRRLDRHSGNSGEERDVLDS